VKKNNIVLIGAGQLGSRHLQALTKLKAPAHITVIDPSRDSLEICKNRACEIEGWNRHTFMYQQNIESLSAVDFAVVATSANVRRQVVEQLLEKTEVRYLLLEKVLFQSSKDCIDVGRLLEKNDVCTWVNAPRRMWPCYRTLKSFLAQDRIFSFVLSGAGWGLACNSYHMLDLFAWLTKGKVDCISSELVEAQPVPSKRPGYLELKGTVSGQFSNGSIFVLSDYRDTEKDLEILIETQNRRIHISEKNGEVRLISGCALPPEIERLKLTPEYQSNLTNLVAEALLTDASCGLTPYEEAGEIHQKMLDAFATKFLQVKEGDLICPIT
jgi:predicted dehydrogenase